MKIKLYPFLRSILSYGLPKNIIYRPGSGGTFSSEYCYSVWLRHLYYLIQNKLFHSVSEINRVAEIGPGDSLGIGLGAIYTGASEYYAFDVIKHSNNTKNLIINNELYNYFLNKKEIPNTYRQRFTAPDLDDYSFPQNILNFTDEHYYNKHNYIETELINQNADSVKIQYVVPWMKTTKKEIRNLDLIFSQAVMEHVYDIEFAYQEMYNWLKPGGVISHQIDFKSHEMTKEWNGHWYIGITMWNFLAQGRKYPMNRLPLSSHIKMIEKAGFQINFIKKVTRENSFIGKRTKVPDVLFSDEDLITSGALVQAIKK